MIGHYLIQQICKKNILYPVSWKSLACTRCFSNQLSSVGKINNERICSTSVMNCSLLHFPNYESKRVLFSKLNANQKRSFKYSRIIKSVDLYKYDNVDRNQYAMVYNSSHNWYIVNGYFFLVFMTVGFIALGIYRLGLQLNLYEASEPQDKVKRELHFFDSAWDFGLAVVLCMLLNCVLYVPASRSILRVYYNIVKNKYLIVTQSIMPYRVNKMEIAPGNVQEIASEETMTFWNVFFGDYKIGSKRYLLYPHLFKNPHHYNALLGYGETR